MAFSFLTQELAIDLGTANTVIFQNNRIILDERFEEKVNISFHIAEDPLKAVARGTCNALKHTDTYKFLMR